MQGDYYINPFSKMSGLTPFEKSIHISAIQIRQGIFGSDDHLKWILYLKEQERFTYIGLENPFYLESWGTYYLERPEIK